MAIEVRVPTILRSYTGGQKVVQGSGDTLSALLDDLDAKHNGLKGRLLTPEGGLHRFVNVYVNDEDVRFLGALDAKLTDGDSITILPAVAGGALGFAAAAALLGSYRPSNHPATALNRAEGYPSNRPATALNRTEGYPSNRPATALNRTEG
jgi:molybdopterin converting factor small subunit